MKDTKKILLTGPPRIGKTTAIKKIAEIIKEKNSIKGFYTEEIREKGKRVGFKIVGFHGEEDVFAHVSIRSKYKVGKYGVDISVLDRMVDSMYPLSKEDIVIIDEIGKMECFSERFRKAVLSVLKEKNPFIGTIALKGNAFIEKIKKLPGIKIIHVTEENRDKLPFQILDFVKI